MPKFSIIIPNWNGIRHLYDCFEALRNQSFADFELVLVDNGSTDGSVAFARSEWPKASIIEVPVNIGFAAAVNRGILASAGRWIVLLNNDTQASPAWLENLSAAVDENPNLSIFASLLVNFYDRDKVDSAGDGMSLFSGPFKIGEGTSPIEFSRRNYVFGACGGGGCYRRDVFDDVGLFDEDFFAYFEDADFSFRANWRGFRTLLVPDAKIYHKVGATSNATSKSTERFDILRRRNLIFLVMKNYPHEFLVSYLPGILAIHLAKFFINIVRGRFGVAFRTQVEIARGFRGMLAKRKSVMASRRISSAEMVTICYGR